MAGSKGPKWYAVRKGRIPGVYRTWSECQAQTNGSGGAVFKSFTTEAEALTFVGNINTNNNLSRASSCAIDVSSSATSDILLKKRNRSHSDTSGNTSFNDIQHKKARSSTLENAKLDLTVDLHFDGGSRGNPGISGAGACVIATTENPSSTKKIRIRHFCGMKCTNNVAEYNGLLQGLKGVHTATKEYVLQSQSTQKSKSHDKNAMKICINIRGDSNLIINQMKGLYKCKHENLIPIYKECCNIVASLTSLGKDHGFTVDIDFAHVYRHDNKVADFLANEAMDNKKSWIEIVLPKDVVDRSDDAELVGDTESKGMGEKQSELVLEDV